MRRYLLLIAVISILAAWGSSAGLILVKGVGELNKAIRDPGVISAVKFSVLQALISAAISVGVGSVLGYIDATYEFRGRSFLRCVIASPFTLPSIGVALAFLLVCRSGILPRGFPAIVAAHVYYNYGFCAIMISSVLSTVPNEIEEAAEVLGASPMTRFLRVVLPSVAKGVVSSFVIVYMLCFTSFAIPLVLGGPGSYTLEVEIYSLATTFLDLRESAAAALLGLGLTAPLAILLMRERPVQMPGEARRRKTLPDGVFGFLILAFYVSAAIAAIYPVAYLFMNSLYNPITSEFNPRVFLEILSRKYNPYLGTSPAKTMVNSLMYGVAASSLALSWSLIAYTSGRNISPLAFLPMATSPMTLALGLYLLGDIAGLQPWMLIIMSHWMISLPFMYRSMASSLSSLDPNLLDAAEVLGMERKDALVSVLLPAIAPGLLAGIFYSFSMSLAETSASTLLSVPGQQPMTVASLQFLSGRMFQESNAMSFLVTAFTLLIFSLEEILQRRLKWLK